MGGPEGEDAVTAGPVEPATTSARAQRKAERQRRREERRRRWESSDAASGADAAGTAVLVADRGEDAPAASSDDTPADARTDADADGAAPVTSAPGVPASGPRMLWLLVLAAHPRQAVVTAALFAAVAALAGAGIEQVGLLAGMVLVGQAMLGWHNDLVDRDRDAAVAATARDRGDGTQPRRKPLADGSLEPGTVWYVFALALLLLAPLSVANGVTAGLAYLLSLAVGLVGNQVLRDGWLSWVPWAASFACYPAVLSYAGPPGGPQGGPPQPALVVLAALLGVVVHVLRSLPGLVADNREGLRHLPLRLALRTGAPRLLGLTGVLGVVVVIALLTTGAQLGLVR